MLKLHYGMSTKIYTPTYTYTHYRDTHQSHKWGDTYIRPIHVCDGKYRLVCNNKYKHYTRTYICTYTHTYINTWKPKNSPQIFATVQFKPSVHEHFQPHLESRDRSTHGGETEQTNLPLQHANHDKGFFVSVAQGQALEMQEFYWYLMGSGRIE